MKIRKGNWKIDLRSFIRLDTTGKIPKLFIHEKFEVYVKWILRILSFIGIATAFITLDYVTGIIVTLVIFIVEQILERTIFEYTVFFIPKFPDFEIEYDKWLSTGYYVLQAEDRHLLLDGLYSFMGPLYEDKDYAEKFFTFIKSWNNYAPIDGDNSINISIIIEENSRYTMYFYPNYSQRILDQYFSKYRHRLALEKYGKQQQEFVMQFIFWHRNLTQGDFFHRFIEDYEITGVFYFVPFYLEDGEPKKLDHLKIEKKHIKIKRRSDLHANEIENIYK